MAAGTAQSIRFCEQSVPYTLRPRGRPETAAGEWTRSTIRAACRTGQRREGCRSWKYKHAAQASVSATRSLALRARVPRRFSVADCFVRLRTAATRSGGRPTALGLQAVSLAPAPLRNVRRLAKHHPPAFRTRNRPPGSDSPLDRSNSRPLAPRKRWFSRTAAERPRWRPFPRPSVHNCGSLPPCGSGPNSAMNSPSWR